MTKNVSLIMAVGPNGLIGVKDKLAWKSKADLDYFKRVTAYHPCIFGATTFYGLPKYPLPNRLNIVLDDKIEKDTVDNRGWVTCDSFESALLFCNHFDEIFVCGGKSVYEYVLKYNFVDTVFLTRVYSEHLQKLVEEGGDSLVYFRDIDDYLKDWSALTIGETIETDSMGNKLTLKFQEYTKI